MSDSTILRTEKLSYTYPDGTRALREIDLSVERGERVAVLGPNGSGKTTLFHHFNGLYMPTSGRVLVAGERVTRDNLRGVRQRVGLVFQDPDDQLIANSVWEDVAFGPRNLDRDEETIEELVQASLEAMDITNLADKTPDQLSGGEKKRAAIAGVLAMQPEVIVLDEPTAGLDPGGTADIIAVMDELHTAGKTLVISTHDVDLAASWADRVYILYEGRVAASGRPSQVFTDSSFIREVGLRTPTLLRTHRELRARGLCADDAPLSVLDLVDGVEKGVRYAISHRDVEQGEQLGLIMRDGCLYTTDEQTGAWGRAAYPAGEGEDILLAGVRGTIGRPEGEIYIVPVPRILEGGSRAVDPANAARKAGTLDADRVAAMGTSAKVLVRKAGLQLDYDVDVVHSAIMAALRGLRVVVFASGGMARHAQARIMENNELRDRSVPCTLEEPLC